MDINAKEHSKDAGSIPKWKIAMCVSNAVQAFYASNPVADDSSYNDPSIYYWNLRNISFEKLRLLELRHVSTGSWQPVLIYAP
ncbi:hypothetical protein BC835DRAFT_61302 [Cytidiella melzeri]|nr:hypothetical protein BC835DRAFT_61302 [Cytidiella melzeri]